MAKKNNGAHFPRQAFGESAPDTSSTAPRDGDLNPLRGKKKPKHTKLVLPNEAKNIAKLPKDRLRRMKIKQKKAVPNQNKKSYDNLKQKGENVANLKENENQANEDFLPPNAVLLPKKRKRAPIARRKKFKRKIVALLAMVFVGVLILLYTSGLYMIIAGRALDLYDGVRIKLLQGGEFPANFSMNGYLKAEPLGRSAYAVLGEKDVAFVAASGKELYRIQHGYASPGISAGKSRACVYNKGGKEYTIVNQSKVLAKVETENEILFAEMSSNGWFVLATSSRYRADVAVYGPNYNGQWKTNLKLVDSKPVMATFAGDNVNFALGCLTAKEGALGSTIHLLKTNSDEILAKIEENARLLQLEYVNNQIIAVYDTFTAVYNSKGEQMAKYAYGNLTLQTVSIGKNMVALVFGSALKESLRMIVLDISMQKVFEKEESTANVPKVLAADKGVFLLVEQSVFSFDKTGAQTDTLMLETKPQGLVNGKNVLLVSAGRLDLLDTLLQPKAAQGKTQSDVDKSGEALEQEKISSNSGSESVAQSQTSAK